MAMFNTTFQGEPKTGRGSPFARKGNVSAGHSVHARNARHVAGIVLRAGLAVLAIATVLALQGLLYVYLWRLPV